jgi:hypothetical protein
MPTATHKTFPTLTALFLLAFLPILASPPLAAQEETAPAAAEEGTGEKTAGKAPAKKEEAPAVAVKAIAVDPSDPGADTLCRLTVTLDNHGERTASLFGFRVTVGGVELPVYERELFAFPVPAGESAELPLFNFWSTETGRPAPAGGKLEVEVTLLEAQWVEIETEDEAEVWTPVGPVPGLPSTESLTLEMKKPGKK